MPYPTINRVLLLGRLTRDPQLRELSSGKTVCALRVACNSGRRGDGGFYEERPNYFDVDVFGALGQHIAHHAHKGERVAVDGQLESREWKNSFQERREAVSVVAQTVRCLPGRPRRRASRQLELVGTGPDDTSTMTVTACPPAQRTTSEETDSLGLAGQSAVDA